MVTDRLGARPIAGQHLDDTRKLLTMGVIAVLTSAVNWLLVTEKDIELLVRKEQERIK